MILDGLDFHNIDELAKLDGADGVRLQRVPERVREQLSEGTAGVMLSPANGEIRFRIAEGTDSATITLSSESPTTVFVYHGDFQGRSFQLDDTPRDFTITPHKRVRSLTRDECPACLYDPGLVRLCFGGSYPEPVWYHGHDGEVALPRDGDVPDRRYLAYGTSITHGTDLAGAAISYPAYVARRLGFDLRNLGASGCCLCEPALADYLAEQVCDLVTLELSVNMIGANFDAAQFKERAQYLVRRVAESDPSRPVACITILPHFRDFDERFCDPPPPSPTEAYRQALRDIVDELDRPNLMLIEGPELLPAIGDLSMDLIHPGVHGMIRIGEALANRLADV